ncbi:molybdopterin synthase catalytic subunit MoaE [Burkholderia thailandensis]|uniref:Molybdopterin synthase catalytic subunit n=1 Tax=Burkholderia thailandensis TaxID=57975 RepID=A0AAW9D4M9_BURTH|nr:molybdopterin synthase catalytic subunit MoaE [Burkholderia thailandensis]AHI65794.1 moaE family protein [Burkholderia thailandensis H0587]AIP63753.1 molybdenum cofactor biosynthesis protein MoaE [Burkholderia thailandensis]AJY28679.1 moaE family protein [Burkholderia thailandensis 34]AOI51773.1 molybdenum cofactor biosynthesis protein MoaE [Burkholderia thailandensis]AOJ50780.1 molybdenum cofactor biosynthesis protein MoaE [Burkholderia thailandensis]
MATVRVQTDDFDVSAEIAALRARNPKVGAVACFVGTVRDLNEGEQVDALELEHYPGMTEKALAAIADDAIARWPGIDVAIVHRVGKLRPLDQIVFVATVSAHRGDAFQSCEFVMDYLKTQAPFWKKENTPAGERWVDARSADDAALARWGVESGNAGRAGNAKRST